MRARALEKWRARCANTCAKWTAYGAAQHAEGRSRILGLGARAEARRRAPARLLRPPCDQHVHLSSRAVRPQGRRQLRARRRPRVCASGCPYAYAHRGRAGAERVRRGPRGRAMANGRTRATGAPSALPFEAGRRARRTEGRRGKKGGGSAPSAEVTANLNRVPSRRASCWLRDLIRLVPGRGARARRAPAHAPPLGAGGRVGRELRGAGRGGRA